MIRANRRIAPGPRVGASPPPWGAGRGRSVSLRDPGAKTSPPAQGLPRRHPGYNHGCDNNCPLGIRLHVEISFFVKSRHPINRSFQIPAMHATSERHYREFAKPIR